MKRFPIYLIFLLLLPLACQEDRGSDEDLDLQREEEYDQGDIFEKRNMETPSQNDPLEFDRNVLELDDLQRDE